MLQKVKTLQVSCLVTLDSVSAFVHLLGNICSNYSLYPEEIGHSSHIFSGEEMQPL